MVRFNEDNEIIREDSYRGIIAGVQRREDIETSMDELEALCEADGIQVVGRLVQPLERPNSATLIGKGKVEELAGLVQLHVKIHAGRAHQLADTCSQGSRLQHLP